LCLQITARLSYNRSQQDALLVKFISIYRFDVCVTVHHISIVIYYHK